MNYIDVEDEALLEFSRLEESFLLESTWRDKGSLEFHYKEHVLKDGELFNPNVPKFSSNMTLEDYKREAEALSEEKAGKHDDKTSTVIGFQLKPRKESDKKKSPRFVKIRRFVNPEFFPKEARGDGNRYREAVLYVDQPTDDNIISYMIIKNNRFFDFVMNMFAEELPENTDERATH